MLKEFSILLKIYTGYLIVPPSFDTVHHFLSQITNSVVTLCSTKVYILLFCLACRTLHVDKCHIILEFLLSSTIMLFFVTADGFQNGCQELGSKYNMNWMLT
jgi:hypothetical protein